MKCSAKMQQVKLPALLLILLAYALCLSNGQQAGCECQVGSTGCAPNCSCLRGDNYYPYYPPKNECRLTDNSSLSILGDIIQATSASFLFQTALTAASISSPSNDDLVVTAWHATNGSIDQIFGSTFSRNGTLISSKPFPISDLSRGSNPTISKRITVLGAQTVFIVIWIEGISGTATNNPIQARCFKYDGSPINNVQPLLNTNNLGMDVSLTSYSAKLMDGSTTLAVYWSSKGDRKIYLNFYTVDLTAGTVTSQGPASQVNTASSIYNREIRPDFLQVYQSGSSTSMLMLVEDMQADNANSTLSAVIWNGNKNALYTFKAISTTTRLYPGATASVIGDKFVVLWNEPGNLQFSKIRALVFDAQAGTAGTPFDFWITSNTTDMSMDLIPISSNALLFGHTQMINRPVSSVCYQVVPWDGNTIPSQVTSDKIACMEGAYGSPDTSAVVWGNGQIAWFWTSSALNVSYIQMMQSYGHVDLNDQITPPISPPIDPPATSPTVSSPSGVIVDPPQSTDTPTDGLVTPSPQNDVVSIAVGVTVVGVALIAGAVLLLLLLRRKKKQKKTKQELKSVDSSVIDFDEGKYISLPTALANVEFTIPREKIQLKEQIAAGSFGAVYLATYNNTPVAVKVHQSDMLALDDFIRESQLALSIKPHPNVLLTLGITQLNSKTIGLVMEYCAGGSLWSQLQGHPPQSKQQVIDMLVSIASGLEHLHSHGIIHRDVAARNVLITAEGHLKLADFGMSRKLKEGDGSKTNQTIGPAASMAPESIRNGTYSKKSDVWMFGILMYEILSGKKPHGSAENLVSVAIDIRETGRIPQLDASVDVFFKQLMVKCCQFEPDHRPDFEQIIQELNEEKNKMNNEGSEENI